MTLPNGIPAFVCRPTNIQIQQYQAGFLSSGVRHKKRCGTPSRLPHLDPLVLDGWLRAIDRLGRQTKHTWQSGAKGDLAQICTCLIPDGLTCFVYGLEVFYLALCYNQEHRAIGPILGASASIANFAKFEYTIPASFSAFKPDNAGCTVPANPSDFYEDARSSSSCKSRIKYLHTNIRNSKCPLPLKAKHQGGQNAFMRHKKSIRLPKASGFRQHVCCLRVDDVVDRTTSDEVAGFMKSGV
ncbi:hypothetical protein PAAG_00423 [Paracoccidioides lutzii Pb01]|uniref:Uncharacterized protein n=1 Tax=Paracoccidioides lutzii (strain ATCC MYA-826 / Pb01) TaxID=502779 RepID=C1GPH8_PARBA|nr:hypothetical protein PAAG_00423 [Paracoccidioides lutzii Pb01]EEH36099.2 hypothetical protein PAAG_00423 [Paracoccidioides lutzii Pb01]